LNVAACHLLELEISCNIRRYEDVCQLTAGYKELWYKVDVPVVNASVFLPWFLPLVVVAIFLEQLKEIREYSQARGGLLTASMLTEAASLVLVSLFSRGGTSNIPSVVVISVNVQDLLAFDTHNTASISYKVRPPSKNLPYPERIHSVKPALVSCLLTPPCGVETYLFPGRQHRIQEQFHPW
jgi:hypothetical protein